MLVTTLCEKARIKYWGKKVVKTVEILHRAFLNQTFMIFSIVEKKR